jgi:hypothetical protein
MVSDFSAKVGAAAVGDGEGEAGETGDAEALGEVAAVAGELFASAEGDGATTSGLGGGRCVAV